MTTKPGYLLKSCFVLPPPPPMPLLFILVIYHTCTLLLSRLLYMILVFSFFQKLHLRVLFSLPGVRCSCVLSYCTLPPTPLPINLIGAIFLVSAPFVIFLMFHLSHSIFQFIALVNYKVPLTAALIPDSYLASYDLFTADPLFKISIPISLPTLLVLNCSLSLSHSLSSDFYRIFYCRTVELLKALIVFPLCYGLLAQSVYLYHLQDTG